MSLQDAQKDQSKPWKVPMLCPACGNMVIPKPYRVMVRNGTLVSTSELRFKCPKRNCGERMLMAEAIYDEFYGEKNDN